VTPAARLSGAIEILDQIVTGLPAEKTLTTWARRNRYAGSGDRAAIRDVVFDVLRRKRSCAALGGGSDGRSLVIGHLRAQGQDPAVLFTGLGYAPAPLTDIELSPLANLAEVPLAVRCDFPDWLHPYLSRTFGDDLAKVMAALQHRAKVFLRVNQRRGDRTAAIAALAREGIVAQSSDIARNALQVTENARKISSSQPYINGLVEVQDAASQAVIDRLDLPENGKVLDYCAGGGGKTLAMAAGCNARWFAHDIEPQRMKDLPTRAGRAGIRVQILDSRAVAARGPYDLVLCDAPCSGSGAWRRSPAGKWDLTEDRLRQLCDIQADILLRASEFVRAGGILAYATCSILDIENIDQIERFLSNNPQYTLENKAILSPLCGADGMAIFSLKKSINLV